MHERRTAVSQTTNTKGRTLFRTAIVGSLIAASLSGCAVGRDYFRPRVTVEESWRTQADGAGSLADLDWWRLFEDPALQGLIRTALEENYDLRLAVARIDEARAQLGIARSEQLPPLDSRGSYANERASQKSFPLKGLPGSSKIDPQHDVYRTSLDLSFELDLWGRRAAARKWRVRSCWRAKRTGARCA